MATKWYVTRDGRRMGPYSGDELQDFADAGRLTARDMVWCDGMTDWVEARTVLKPAHLRRPPRGEDYERDEPGRYEAGRYEPEDAVRAAPGSRSEFPGRLITTGFFLFALLMYFLPWVDVRGGLFNLSYQSGLQAGLGSFSDSTNFFEIFVGRRFHLDQDKVRPAPLMLAFGGLIFLGMVLGLALPAGWWRMGVLGLLSVLACTLIMIQVSAGFPINEAVTQANADPNLRQNIGNPFPLFPNGDFLRVSTTPWLWLAVMLTLGSLGGLVLEHTAVFTWGDRRRD